MKARTFMLLALLVCCLSDSTAYGSRRAAKTSWKREKTNKDIKRNELDVRAGHFEPRITEEYEDWLKIGSGCIPMEEFLCPGSGLCIPMQWKCDATPDCKDGSDESGCQMENLACAADQFSCWTDPPACISGSKRCDRQEDCTNGLDEKNCFTKTCRKRAFLCNDTSACIPKENLCDGINHCQDGSDEWYCDLCNDIEFKCHSNRCIPKAWVCDNYTDCDDGSDETNCDYDLTTRSQYYTTPRYSNCSFAEFHCDDKCITNSWVCDNYPDCNDGTDEVSCDHGTTRGPQFWSTESSWSPAGCNYTEFHCDDKCIPNNWVCDNYGDCSDGSDEANCAGTTQRYTTYSYNGRRQDLCDSSEYLCDSIKCIPESWVCDNYTDCNDNLDEMYCGSGDGYVTDGNLAFTTPRYCNFTEFQCDIGKCIRDSWVCDGYYDCADGTDEGNCGGTTSYEFPDSYTTESNRFFKCLHTGELIPEEFVCDNYTDCRDDTDEENCQVA